MIMLKSPVTIIQLRESLIPITPPPDPHRAFGRVAVSVLEACDGGGTPAKPPLSDKQSGVILQALQTESCFQRPSNKGPGHGAFIKDINLQVSLSVIVIAVV